MEIEKIKSLVNETEEQVNLVKEMSDEIVNKYTKVLDEVMLDIKTNIVDNQATLGVIQDYFTSLSTIYYFVSSKCEILGLYEDIAKSNARVKFNTIYGDKQATETIGNKKPTVAELTASAEMGSLDESVVSAIYSRSFKIVKAKLEAADTMISTLSKIISSQDTERKLTGVVDF